MDERELKRYGMGEKTMTQLERGAEEVTEVTLAEVGISHTDKRSNWKCIHSSH